MTSQSFDYLYENGIKYNVLYNGHLKTTRDVHFEYPVPYKIKSSRFKVTKKIAIAPTSMHRGFQVEWEIIDKKLYLKKILSSPKFDMKMASSPILFENFSGLLGICDSNGVELHIFIENAKEQWRKKYSDK